MGEIGKRFCEVKDEGRLALIPFIMAGDPNPGATVEIARALEEAGADMIELGLCFSDPIADGPTIQAASQRALAAGVTPDAYFGLAREVSEAVSAPLIALTYYNTVLRVGLRDFLGKCVRSGILGIIVPDLPVDEAGPLVSAAGDSSVDTIFLAAPTSPTSRLKRIVRASTGFVYLVSVLGVTGARDSIPEGVGGLLKKIRGIGSVPVAVGFGISSPAHVRMMGKLGADGVIVGSALIDIISGGPPDRMLPKLVKFFRKLREAAKV